MEATNSTFPQVHQKGGFARWHIRKNIFEARDKVGCSLY